jgi:GNAT superfamily N-acetyltransferase
MALRIRDAAPSEHAAVADLTEAAYRQYEEDLGAHWAPYLADLRDIESRRARGQLIVAELDGDLVGCVTFLPSYRNDAIPGDVPAASGGCGFRVLATAPAARGYGVGEALVRECVRRARDLGAPSLLLHTGSFMEAAVRLYERLGFTRVVADGDPGVDSRLLTYRLAL